jgi:hypothetical protein
MEGESRSISHRLPSVDRGGAEASEPVIGYLLVEAGSLEDATEVARGCPGLNHGFVIEVYRPFEREFGY